MKVDAARLQPGGDIRESYSADRLHEGQPIRRPFAWGGALWTCTGAAARVCTAYRLVPWAQATVAVTYDTRAAMDAREAPGGFYNGVQTRYERKPYVLVGPPVFFEPEA